jgi:hypothetical protein
MQALADLFSFMHLLKQKFVGTVRSNPLSENGPINPLQNQFSTRARVRRGFVEQWLKELDMAAVT